MISITFVNQVTLRQTFIVFLPKHYPQRSGTDLGRMANLKLVDKQGKELVELNLQVLA
jgi:hypothetical protein